MAQNNNKAVKKQTRADRRAAEAAALREQEERAAKERRQQTIIGAIVAVIVVVLVAVAGVAIWRSVHPSEDGGTSSNITIDEAYTQLQQVATKPSRADEQGGIVISNGGYGTKAEGAPTVAIYMDFLCPGCGSLHRELDDTLVEMMQAGQINIELHFMAFMDRYSTDDYSSRAANAALYITEHDDDPAHLLAFLQRMYAEDFQPEEGSAYESVSDDQIREQAIAAGVSEDVADGMFGGEYYDWLDAVDRYTPMRSELFNQSGSLKGSMSTPTVTINGHFWDLNDLTLADMTMYDGLLMSLGLDDADVGVAGVMPSIGADGEPISVTTGS
ncbi:DsbA family protein [Bifidobacterium phasiani]|uniref:Thioredoxin domain-containing protein n=1 Tax=Bifidobacterium phasiani TaxID=2834431 RepID=A0ABS6W762_9BIFI|nr:thioredoxin domain-containing protein [Bifidobacterium phasiani]MBW3082192.1 thioredoxin domain-containing protein [Bifidobacterium phasiani]